MSFATLNDVTEIDLELVTLGSLSIRAGDQLDSLSDSPIIRIGGSPVIPGSSLKGALRSSLEGLLAARLPPFRVCLQETTIPNALKEENKREEKRRYLNDLKRKAACHPNFPDELCPVCRIFGTVGGKSGLSGAAIFIDALPAENTIAETGERTHVAITRDTRSQAGGALVTVESVDAGAKFSGQIRLINPEAWQVGALLEAMEWLKKLGLGSKKTAGYGQIEISVPTIRNQRLVNGAWQPSKVNAADAVRAFEEKYPARGDASH